MHGLLTIIIGSGILIPTLAWLTRSIILHWLDKDVESYKLQLQLVAQEHQIRFAKLHEKQANIINQLYDMLLVVKACLDKLNNSHASSFTAEDRIIVDTLSEKCLEAMLFFHKHSLYFSDSLYKKMMDFSTKTFRYSEFFPALSNLVDETGKTAKPEFVQIVKETVYQSWKGMYAEVTPILDELKLEFRKMLGVK